MCLKIQNTVMKVRDFIEENKSTGKPVFSFEILPPLKGNSIQKVYNVIDKLKEFGPKYINITSHHSETVYVPQADGNLKKATVRKRPGTVAVAAAIQNKYGIQAVPHIICKGFTKEETEYALLDLNFLGISNLLLLRGDAKSLDIPAKDRDLYHEHATDLQRQVNLFNESDIYYLKEKVRNGADYVVTQMFFDNEKYYSFVERCRKEGINVPIIPGIKPVVLKSQLTVLPRVFRTDIPEPLAAELRKCKTDDEVKEVGVEWSIEQCKDLIRHGVEGLHFYTLLASDSVRKIAEAIY